MGLKEKKEKKKKVKSRQIPGELDVDIEQPNHEEYIVKPNTEVANQSVDTTTSDVDIKLEEAVHVITGELTIDRETPTIEVTTNMIDSEFSGDSATASLPVIETPVEEKLPEQPSIKHDQSSSSSSSESEDESVMPTEDGEKKKKVKKIKVKKEKKPKEKKEKKPKEKKDKKKKDKSVKLAGEMSIDIEPETSEDITVTIDPEIGDESEKITLHDVDIQVGPSPKPDESSSSSSSESEDEGVMPTEDGEKKKKLKKMKVKKEKKPKVKKKKKPKEKKEKKPKEKKEKKKKEKSTKIPGGLEIAAEVPQGDVNIISDAEVRVESVETTLSLPSIQTKESDHVEAVEFEIDMETPTNEDISVGSISVEVIPETPVVVLPDFDETKEELIDQDPTQVAGIPSKPLGTFDLEIDDQVEDLILNYEIGEKQETISDLVVEVPLTIIEVPEKVDTDITTPAVDEDTIVVVSEDIVEQAVDFTSYDIVTDGIDTSLIVPKQSFEISTSLDDEEDKYEATDLLRPLENDIPVLEAIENELDE